MRNGGVNGSDVEKGPLIAGDAKSDPKKGPRAGSAAEGPAHAGSGRGD